MKSEQCACESLSTFSGLAEACMDLPGSTTCPAAHSAVSHPQAGMQDIPQDLKASSGKQSVSVAVQVQGQGGSEAQPHRKELRSPEEPRKAALKASQGLQTSASEQQQQQQQPNPLGHYFQGGGARKGGQKGPPSQEAQDPPESPLKYYFTNQIPEEVKARLALDAAVRAKGASR